MQCIANKFAHAADNVILAKACSWCVCNITVIFNLKKLYLRLKHIV